MPEVHIVKPFRVSSSEPMKVPGEIVDVDDEMLVKLVRLGIVEDPEAPAAEGVEANSSAPGRDGADDKPALEPEDSAVEPISGSYPPPPEKTALVAEFKEYARRHEINLTGLTKRNEIVGYIYKVVAGQ